MEKLEQFKKLGLSENTLKAIYKKGFEEPTQIQEMTIPFLLQEEMDIICQAQTGTGKTAAFGLPLIERLNERSPNVQAIILTPTRELAIQVSEEINSLKGKKKLHIIPIYGGQSIEQQLMKLRKGVDIVVGTPGRVNDHIRRKSLILKNISYLILDEADEMLNMGFLEDVEEILRNTNFEKRMLLFSATMPQKIINLAKKYMGAYKMVSEKKAGLTVNLTDQIYFEVSASDKFEALCRIIDISKEFYGLIFCRTKIGVDNVASKLIDRGYEAEALHGDISQYQRERILNKFKKQRVNILVATDVAARGIDIIDLTHVINFSLPQDPEGYVHRIGRTGRAGKGGTAITFVTPDEYRKILFIKRFAKTDIRKEKIPEIEDIINAKKERIKAELSNIITLENYDDYIKMSNELLEGNSAENVLAALLKYSFHDELNEKSYTKIKGINIDRTGKTRLFVARGRADDMTPRKLVDLIMEETDIEHWKIRDIRIFDKFSFITVPFEESEIILEVFKRKSHGRRPIVAPAKEKKKPHEMKYRNKFQR